MITQRLIERVKMDEGYKKFPYRDSIGIETIAYGRNLRDNGISEAEALVMLQNDLSHIYQELALHWPTFLVLDQVRQEALMNMGMMGVTKLLGFRKMLAALNVRDYKTAAQELLDSEYAKQVGLRAHRLACQIETGAPQ